MSMLDNLRSALGQGERASHPAPRAAQPANSAPAAPGDVLAGLRRAIARMEQRPPVAAPPIRQQVLHPAPWRAQSLSPRVYTHRVAVGERFGRAEIPAPSQAFAARMHELIQLTVLDGGVTVPAFKPGGICFVDLETTGLSRSAGTLPFVIGLGRFDEIGDAFVVTQIFLESPAQEPAALDMVQHACERSQLLVTFNGRGFDVPLLENRALLNRKRLGLLDRPHLDLLPPCRALFRPRLEDCRLATLERSLLGYQRTSDMPGAEAPRIYREFLRTGRMDEVSAILTHNKLDLVLMLPLAVRLAQHATDPLHHAEDSEELLAAARLQVRRGNPATAEACLRRGLCLCRVPSTKRRLLQALGDLHRRRDEPAKAASIWDQYRREFPEHEAGWLALSKYHEHVTRDLPQALALARACPRAADDEAALERRVNRLERRLERVGASGT